MFHLIITLAYIIPNIYVFLRIWKLFINKEYKIHYTVIYLLLAAIYPISNMFSDGDSGIKATLTFISQYLLPFYLYLFLSVLLLDTLLLLNLLLKIIPIERLRSARLKIIGLPAVILLAVSVVIAGIINFNTIRTSEYNIEIPARSSGMKHLRIAFAADFHLKNSVSKDFVQSFVNKIADINPDLMIFGGDIVEGDRDDGNLETFEKLICGIRSKYGVYAVLGNHEYYSGQDKGSFFERSCMKLLCDTVIVIDSSFSLAGRYDSHVGNRKSVNELLSTATDSLPLILVDHRPTEIAQVSVTATDVQLSGHTHNGQMFPINLITKKVYELSWGYRKIGHTHFFVTSGIRLWGPPVRTAGKSEIMIINIDFKGN